MSHRITSRIRLASALAGAALLTTLTGCEIADELATTAEELLGVDEQTEVQDFDTADSGDGDYYTILGSAELEYEPTTPGVVEYCATDALDRAVCAYGELTSELRAEAQARGRQDITVDPSGWPEDNREVHIPALDHVEGSKDYNGWFYNRSHMVADSLGGSADIENLVTGTRTQNVGSTQGGGMAYTEEMARDYLDTTDADTCPLYYSAQPQYQGDELVPRTVLVDIRSCDGAIDQRVEVSNTANGWGIDYATGDYTEIN